MRSRMIRSLAPASVAVALALSNASALHAQVHEPELADRVVIRRTAYGVPHILADDLRAFGFGMAYVQLEDYGVRIVEGLIEARGEAAKRLDPDEVDDDFVERLRYRRAVETYHRLHGDTRDVLEGFAAGVNHYIGLHPDEFPDGVEPDFTGYDVHARGIGGPSLGAIRRFVERLEARDTAGDAVAAASADRSAGLGAARAAGRSRPAGGDLASDGRDAGAAARALADGEAAEPPSSPYTPWMLAARDEPAPHPDVGSNAWAFAPERTESGHAILVRNPHLSWDAGYYEAHVTVPGELNFYGDFRIGGPFGIIGGFNEHLGWSTTNNYMDLDEVYAFDVDPERPDHYLLDGASLPVEREEVTVEFRNGDGLGRETRTFLFTPFGPVIHRADGRIYVFKAAGDGEYRTGEQFLRMLRATSLEEWKDAMRMRARIASNFTYADADGNILYVWNANMPVLPHAPGGDTVAVPADGTEGIWRRITPWDSLPQVLDPEGGYVHNENDPFHYANLNEVMDPADFPANYPEPRLRLRSQHSLELIANDRKLSLEDVVELKHSMRMLLADRVKADLVAAVRRTNPTDEIADAIELIDEWDDTVARDSRGGVLFRTWWWRYVETGEEAEGTPASADFDATPESLFTEPWTAERPMETPRGLADPERAVEAFRWAVDETEERWGAWDVAWGDVHRVRMGDVDVPVGGCTGLLGCFRVLWYDETDDGRLAVRGGDGWVFAVEFGETPRAYTILAYGQSDKPDSPHDTDQAEMFADNRMKRIAFTEDDIRDQLVRAYHPGGESGAGESEQPEDFGGSEGPEDTDAGRR